MSNCASTSAVLTVEDGGGKWPVNVRIAAAMQTLMLALDPSPAAMGIVLRMVNAWDDSGLPRQTLNRI
jgi:hypothetical protein